MLSRRKWQEEDLPPILQHIFTSRVSGRGYRNGAVCVSVCVCVGVCLLALSQPNCSTYGHEIWYRG